MINGSSLEFTVASDPHHVYHRPARRQRFSPGDSANMHIRRAVCQVEPYSPCVKLVRWHCRRQNPACIHRPRRTREKAVETNVDARGNRA